MVNRKRVRILKKAEKKAGPVIYWMSRDQRVRDNWALLFAQELSLQEKVPMAVVFCLAPKFLDATMRHYGFMLKGLQEVEQNLAEKNIPFLLLPGSPPSQFPRFVKKHGIGILITDFDPIRIKREWREAVTGSLPWWADGPWIDTGQEESVFSWEHLPA